MKFIKTIFRLSFVALCAKVMVFLIGTVHLNAEILDRENEIMQVSLGGRVSLKEVLEGVKLEHPKDEQVLAYFGSTNGISADQVWDSMTMGEFGNLGTRYLDIVLETELDDNVDRPKLETEPDEIDVWTNKTYDFKTKAEALDRVREFLQVASEGDIDALKEVLEILESLKVEHPNDAKVLAFLGSAYGIAASQTWNPMNMVEFGRLGIRYLDIALEIEPEDWEVRVNRAYFNTSAPFFMGRYAAGIEDILTLDKIFRGNPTIFHKHAKWSLAFHMLKFYDILIEEDPENSNWTEGKILAERHVQ